MLSKWLKESNYTVIFTGAGMSTESGIPDFRSAKTGLWNKVDPIKLSSTYALEKNVDEFIQFYRARILELKKFKPHKGHEILATWEKKGLVQSIITQNIDGFHQRSGSQRVAEIHGTLQKVYCQQCGKSYSNEKYIQEEYKCECGGLLRPAVVLFGEMLPEDALNWSMEETNRADLFIVLGSSLTVTPANQFPMIAKQNGAKLVIINYDETGLDPFADEVIHKRKIGEVLQEINEQLM